MLSALTHSKFEQKQFCLFLMEFPDDKLVFHDLPLCFEFVVVGVSFFKKKKKKTILLL
jgi:hypothetical protein